MVKKTITINIDDNNMPELFKLNNDEINNKIIYLLNIGYQQVYSSINEINIVEKVDNICRRFKDDILNGMNEKNTIITSDIHRMDDSLNKMNIDKKFDEFNEVISTLFGINNTSNKKGEISENLIYKIMEEKYKDYNYEKKRHIAHSGDGELNSPSGMKSLVEIKNYSNIVNKDELEKFRYDMKFTKNNLGLFISLKTGIIGKRQIDYETFKDGDEDYHIIYISKIMEDINKLDCGIMLLENIYKVSSRDNIDLKIDQLKKVIFDNFTELETLTKKTYSLRKDYSVLETNIKTNLDKFYNQLREYELEIKTKMQNVWSNLFKDMENLERNYIDEKTSILNDVGTNDKCFSVLSRTFDILNENSVNVTKRDGVLFDLIHNGNIIGTIKKMKDKIVISLEKVNINITISEKENKDQNIEFFTLLLQKIIS